MAIITLTTIPPRFDKITPVLEALTAQSAKIDEVWLTIPKRYRRFPEYKGEKPSVPRNVRVFQPEEDFGPASKVLSTALELKGENVPILFCDDDRIYGRRWAEALLRGLTERSDACIAAYGVELSKLAPGARNGTRQPRATIGRSKFDMPYRRRRFQQVWREKSLSPKSQKPPHARVMAGGYADILLGVNGCAVWPHFFDEAFYDIPEHIRMVDDVWLSGHFERKGIPIWLPARVDPGDYAETRDIAGLHTTEMDAKSRAQIHLNAINHFRRTYGIWQ